MKIGERSHRNAIDAIDYVAFDERLNATGSAKFGNQPVWIDVFNVETLNTRQMPIGKQLRGQFRERDPEMQCVAARVRSLRIWCCWSRPLARTLRRSLAKCDLHSFLFEFAVRVSQESQ